MLAGLEESKLQRVAHCYVAQAVCTVISATAVCHGHVPVAPCCWQQGTPCSVCVAGAAQMVSDAGQFVRIRCGFVTGHSAVFYALSCRQLAWRCLAQTLMWCCCKCQAAQIRARQTRAMGK